MAVDYNMALFFGNHYRFDFYLTTAAP
jgi:hypothetical protein